jgi:hypothetical protein
MTMLSDATLKARCIMLEILLAMAAWRRGWKAMALIPLGLAAAFGFMMGAAGVSSREPSFALLLPDLIATAVLGIMCVVPPQAAVNTTAEPKKELAAR